MALFFPRLGRVALLVAGLRLAAADDLPKRVSGDRPDSEPPLILDDLPNLPLPFSAAAGERLEVVTGVSVERAQAELERARRRQQHWQQLAKAGVLSQVEAESTALPVARALVKYHALLAAQAAAQAGQCRARRELGEGAAEELAAAETAERTAAALAAEADAQLQRQQRLTAAANLDRQRRLFALGIASPKQFQRAQTAVEKLSGMPAPK